MSYDPNVFGRIVTGNDVEDALVATVRTWMPAYLAERERVEGRDAGSYPEFRSFVALQDVTQVATDTQTPACITVVPGLANIPDRHGDGTFAATWVCGVGALVEARTPGESLRVGRVYVAALRALLLQHPSLGGFANGLTWVQENYDELDRTEVRTAVAGWLQVDVTVDKVVDAYGGPLAVPADIYTPPPPSATVETVVVTTNRRH